MQIVKLVMHDLVKVKSGDELLFKDNETNKD